MTENRKNSIVSMATYTAHKLRNPMLSDMVLRKISLYHNFSSNKYFIEYEHVCANNLKKIGVSVPITLYNPNDYRLFEDTIRKMFPPVHFFESELTSVFLYLV